MRERAAEVLAVAALAAILTVVIAAPVLLAPSERVFGMEIVGRHHDPFTVMQQFERPFHLGTYSQPVTDGAGALLSRVTGAVAAYNWIVLLSFPLSATAAYLLARHLRLSRTGAAVAALAFAFSPFHLAHAAYHPQVAQTQWLPLYLLALWRCVDRPAPLSIGALFAATCAVTLSNFYGGLIAATLTPVALVSYWLATLQAYPHAWRRLGITVASLSGMAAAGVLYVSSAAATVLANRDSFAFPREDLFLYSAKWWSYLVPPVAHPWLGPAAMRFWEDAGVRKGLLEQQVSLGWGIVALGLVAIYWWIKQDRPPASRARVPVLVAVAVAALLCSLSPERTIGAFTIERPSGFLYTLMPMFRSYARFGVIVQLMAAVLAGVGVDQLRQFASRRARFAGVALLALAAGEYAVAPPALWRDVLPTTAHRWVMQQPGRVQVLDCTPFSAESASVPWLTGGRTRVLGGMITDCTEPHLSQTLAANGYTHVLVRHGSSAEPSFTDPHTLEGLSVAAHFNDGSVFAVTAPAPAIYTAAMLKFSPRERDAEWSWRWMGSDGTWRIVNTRARPIVAAVGVEISAFHRARKMELRLDGQTVQVFEVEPARRVYEIGPLIVPPGNHELVFHPAEAPTVAAEVIDNRDPRPLSFALGQWTWVVRGEQE
ncbi:MAG: hypothetical protein ABI665_04370 [Vicinamibacterales bacterium]